MRRSPLRGHGTVYVIIVGAGKVGWNLTRELMANDQEVTLLESDHRKY